MAMVVEQWGHMDMACCSSGATVAAVPAGVKAAKFFTSQAPKASATPISSRKRVTARRTSKGACGRLPMGEPPFRSEEEHRLQGCLRVVAAAGAVLAAGEDRLVRAVIPQIQAQRHLGKAQGGAFEI